MFYWKSWVCAIIPLFNLQKDITQRYLVEHKGLWIRIKVQRSVTVLKPGSYFDAPKAGFYEKAWAIMHQCYGQLPSFMIWLTANRYKWTFDPEQTAHIARSQLLRSSREALMGLSLWWMRRKRRTQWENLHRLHDQSCDKGQTLPAWHSPTKKIKIYLRVTVLHLTKAFN